MSEQSRKPVSARPEVGRQSLLVDLLMRPLVSLCWIPVSCQLVPSTKYYFTHAMSLVLATALD